MAAVDGTTSFNFLIVNDECGILDLFKLLVMKDGDTSSKFLTGDGGKVASDHRWVIVASVIARKIIKVLGKPMQLIGYLIEFFLNLLSLNGDFLGLFYNALNGKVRMPERGSETFVSAIGHLDKRLQLYNFAESSDENGFDGKQWRVEMGNRGLMDLCVMASKLAYENENVVRNIVQHYWKMHFVAFYNCWNDYQKEHSTQVFVICDKAEDANLIVISFRGTEPFDADDWITDFDYSWYDIPELGKVHMGFLEALGLGNRAETSSFQKLLMSQNEQSIPVMRKMTAYYTLRSNLKKLLKQHQNAKFIVTGHSLGGALAVLFPAVLVLHEETEMMQRLLGIYTYGQPRVGDEALGRYMESHLEHPESKYFRVVYCNDVVPRLPYDDKTFLYKHFGVCLYYDSLYIERVSRLCRLLHRIWTDIVDFVQEVDEEPNKNYFGLWYVIPEYMNAVWELGRSLIMGYVVGAGYKETWESSVVRVVGLAMPGVSAHSPVDYVNCVRLGRKRSSVN